MWQAIRRYFLALDDTLLLGIYAACWLLAVFAPSNQPLGLATVGRVLSAIALTVVALSWIARPALGRLGWRLRDLALVFVLLVVTFEASQSQIRSAALLDLLEAIELAALYVVAAYLCARRPQPLFLTTLLLLGGATAVAWRWRYPLFPTLDPVVLSELTALAFLAFLPWLAVRLFRRWGRWYPWLALAVAAALVVVEGISGIAGRPGWIHSWLASLAPETRQVMASILRDRWLVGCGAGHYEWLFRAWMPEEFAGQIALLPGALLILIERGVIGFVALLTFGIAALSPSRPGPWAAGNDEVFVLARPLRSATAFAFLLFLATPALHSTFGQVLLWSFLGMLRSWSGSQAPGVVSLVAQSRETAAAPVPAASEEAGGKLAPPIWQWYHPFLMVGAVLAGIGLIVFQVRPLVGAVYRRCPRGMALSAPAFLDRVELARWWWPYDPRTYELEAAHYRAKAGAGQPLSTVEIGLVAQAYERVIRSNPYEPMSHLALARWNRARGEIKKAVEAARRGLAYCPASFEIQYSLAGCYRRLEDATQAEAAYLRAHQMRPRSAPVLLNLADLELRRGNARAAQHYLHLARQIRPNDRAIQALLSAIAEGQVAEALGQMSAKDTDARNDRDVQ